MEPSNELVELESTIRTYITPASFSSVSEIFTFVSPPEALIDLMYAIMISLFEECEKSWHAIRIKCKGPGIFIQMLIKAQNEKVPIGDDRIKRIKAIIYKTPGFEDRVRCLARDAHSLYLWIRDFVKILELSSIQKSQSSGFFIT